MRVLAAFFFNVLCNFAIGLLVAKFLGPAEYGRFALAFAVAVAVQSAFFDCLKLGATRFYSERVRTENPTLRATLDISFITIALSIGVASSIMFLSGAHFKLSNGLIALALVTAVSNGVFDYNTALVRARFHDQLYTRLVLVKNTLALLLTGGWCLHLSLCHHGAGRPASSACPAPVITARAALRDHGTTRQHASLATAKLIFSYSLPIVCANVLYLSIRWPIARSSRPLYGFFRNRPIFARLRPWQQGDSGDRLDLDVVLFQIAVALHDQHGPSKAKTQVARNMAIVIAVVLPACTGIWLTLPSVENVVVPVAYRGPFGQLLTLMMAGLFSSAIVQYGINPIFQIAKTYRSAHRCGGDRLPRRRCADHGSAKEPGCFELCRRPDRRPTSPGLGRACHHGDLYQAAMAGACAILSSLRWRRPPWPPRSCRYASTIPDY